MHMAAALQVWAEWIINYSKVSSQLTNVDGPDKNKNPIMNTWWGFRF